MSGSGSQPRKKRRLQRFFVGIAMSLIAFAMERVVVRAMKRERTS